MKKKKKSNTIKVMGSENNFHPEQALGSIWPGQRTRAWTSDDKRRKPVFPPKRKNKTTPHQGHRGGRLSVREGWTPNAFIGPSSSWQLNVLEEMSGRQAEVSARARGDGWFTLWPVSASLQSSHRKIMSPSNEFMQTAVHLSGDKKMIRFHFKMKTREVFSRLKLAKVSTA